MMMENSIRYSVVIRTLGTSGEKYETLLDSLKGQTIPPVEILVVLPEDGALPGERLGTERFVRTRKGMVRQRSFGMQVAKGDFLLLCDDDISFESDLVEKLYRTHLDTGAEIVTPNVLSPDGPKPSSLKTMLVRLRDFLCGLNYVSLKPSPYNIRIWDTGGYIKNGRIEKGRQYYSQSGHGTCAFLKKGTAEFLRFQDEMWLEDAPYPLPEDQVMFYKAYLQGNTIAWCQEAKIWHLDAGHDTPDKFRHMSYANGRNFTVFWHRFLYNVNADVARKTRLISFLTFRIFNTCLLYGAIYLPNPRRSKAALALYKGYIDAFRYLGTEEYKRLPIVRNRSVEPKN
ncbi:MAG: glycosyltransferase family 2 protein [Candidatus Aminicenantales bacterium]